SMPVNCCTSKPTKAPIKAPPNILGAKTPPSPPNFKVKPVAKGFNRTAASKIQIPVVMDTCSVNACIAWYPSPYKGGITYNKPPNSKPPAKSCIYRCDSKKGCLLIHTTVLVI